jgi:uncharacterized protein
MTSYKQSNNLKTIIMKKAIIIFGLALVAFTNVSFASTVQSSTSKEMVFFKNTPLCQAIVKGDLETVKKFIEYGADVNEATQGLTPLMLAARYNRTDILKVLLENGARKDIKDDRGFDAIKYAELSKATDALALLKKA